MNITLMCAYDENYIPLGELTWNQNKVVYAKLNGYGAECKVVNKWDAWDKVMYQKELLEDTSKKIDWLWWAGCDSLITNFDIKLESIIDENYHVIVSADINGINADSILVKNSTEGRAFINALADARFETKYNQQPTQYEQQAMNDMIPQWKNIVKIVPQRVFNSYDYSYLPWPSPQLDKTGNHGNWMQGDFVIHWPAMTLPRRIKFAEHYSRSIVGKQVYNPYVW